MKNKVFTMLLAASMVFSFSTIFNEKSYAQCGCSTPCPIAKRTTSAINGTNKKCTYHARKLTKGCPKNGCPCRTASTQTTPCPCQTR